MSDQDLPYNYTDKQGQPFTVWAGSEAEAWRLAKAESNYRDEAYQAAQQARQAKQETLYGDVLTGDWRNDRIDRIIEDGRADLVRQHNARISAGAGKNGLHGSLARDYRLPDDNYVSSASPGGGSQSTSSSASTEPKEGFTCSGFLAAAVMLFILCGLASGCVAWLEEIAP